MRFAILAAALCAVAIGCAPPQPVPETTAAPDLGATAETPASGLLASVGSTALAAVEPAGGPALTLTLGAVTSGEAEGQDAVVTVRLEASATQFVVLQERNHTPYDTMAQSAGGVLATAIGAPADVVQVLYQVTQSVGAPLVCGPNGPANVVLYEDEVGALVITGLNDFSLEDAGGEGEITLAPLPATVVCGRAVYQPAP
ncbi:MAG: hypothetical protein ACOYKM_01820 [Caulobacterales bacterium]